MENIFTTRAHRYEKRFNYPIVSSYMKNRDKHIKNFLSRASGSLLDIGCGTGYYLKGFVERFSKITAVDSSAQMLRIFLENNHEKSISIIRADVKKFSVKKKFDNVICIGLINYISENETTNLMKKIHNFIKPGGHVLITAPSTEKLSGHAYKAIWRARGTKINLYSKKFLIEKMKAAGFKNIEVKNAKDFPTFHIILEASK